MIILGGVGALSPPGGIGTGDLMMPTPAREMAEQWIFGRGDRDDLASVADAAAGEGIQHTAGERQAALERLFAEIVVASHSQALDDARTESPDVELFSAECQQVLLVMQQKIERLRFTDQAGILAEVRAYASAPIADILAGPVAQWRSLIAQKIVAIAVDAHEAALNDCLRDIGPDHPTCSSALVLMRVAIAREQYR